jgi:ferredoxin
MADPSSTNHDTPDEQGTDGPPSRRRLVLDLDLEAFGRQATPTAGRVTLLPMGSSVQLDPGESIFEGARRVGVAIPTECGGKGTCGRCRVQFALPARPPTAVERQHIDRADLSRGIRLACRSRPAEDLIVTVLPEQRRR